MSVDTDKFPKNFEDFREEIWESEASGAATCSAFTQEGRSQGDSE